MIDCNKKTRRHQIYIQNSTDLITKHFVFLNISEIILIGLP